jgi:branched-subunit amino acid transport protein
VSVAWLILAMGAGVYALRLAGLMLPDGAVRAAWDRALGFVPIALLTALVVASLGSGGDGSGVRLVAAAGGALVAYRTGQMWACIVAGMLLYGVLALSLR